jgi:hypothetical protein
VRFEPHVPPHVVPAPAQAVRAPWGAPLTCVQLPGVTSHASHCPVQPLLQQNPSTQKPDLHIPFDAHRSPSSSRPWHLPAMHTAGATQSASLAQTLLHSTALSQMKAPHEVVCGAGQAPLPSQTAALVFTLALHD